MQPASRYLADCSATSSIEGLNSGLVYNSVYYEEEQLYSVGPTYNRCSHQNKKPVEKPPVEICEPRTTRVDLPPISWHGYKTVPKILNLTNTGRTILINGQWMKGRPYIEGGPLNGAYIFSQIHFHSPSEHEVNGRRYPLEMHVVHYKASYLTQERAMLERDGTVVLVYLLEVDETQTALSFMNLTPQIEKVYSQTEAKDISFEKIVKPFTSNYYIYWGSVGTGKSSYILQWIVNGSILGVTPKEAEGLLRILNKEEVCGKSTPRVKPENDTVFYVDKVEFDEEKENEEQCHVCHSNHEWCHHYAHSCSHKYDYEPQRDDSSINFHFGVCRREDDCRSQPTLSNADNPICGCTKTLSGLQLCCRNKRKFQKKRGDHYYITHCCSHAVCAGCASPPEEPEEQCIPQHNIAELVEHIEEVTSCISVIEDEELSLYEQLVSPDEKEMVNINVLCSCPTDKNTCDEEKEEKVKNKRKDSCTKIKFGFCKKKLRKKNEKKEAEKKEAEKKEAEKMEAEKKEAEKKEAEKKEAEKKEEEKKEAEKKEPEKKEPEKKEPEKKEPEKKEPEKKEPEKKEPEKKEPEKKEPEKKEEEKKEAEKKEPEKKEEEKKEAEKKEPEKKEDEKKEVKKEGKKRERRKCKKKCLNDHNSEQDSRKSASRASTASRSSKKEKYRKETTKEPEIPVGCLISMLPEKSFEEILREYDTNWLNDSRVGISNTNSKLSAESYDIDSLKDMPSTNPSMDTDDNAITTIFEKKREAKNSPAPVEDCTVNFLLKPTIHSNPASLFLSSKPVSEDVDSPGNTVSNNIPGITVNKVKLLGANMPAENADESPKEFCFLAELLFRSSNKNFTECVAQEYNLALMYNQNILQEYKGSFCPKNLQIGSYEKLELSPKYPELNNINILLEDCTVKLESPDQLSMRAKFVMNELNFKNLENVSEIDSEQNPEKKIVVVCDADTQCSLKEFESSRDIDCLEKIRLRAQLSEFSQNKASPSASNTSCNRLNFTSESTLLPKNSLNQINLKNVVCNFKSNHKLEKESEIEEEYKEKFNSDDVSRKSKKKRNSIGKEFTKNTAKELKQLFTSRKKTVYFMYQKIEKDESSGKKVFVGSFRSKYDMNDISKGKSLRNCPSSSTTDNMEEKNILLFPAVTTTDDITITNTQGKDLKFHTPIQSKHSLNDKKDMITLHKFKPKHLGVDNSKKEGLNVVVGKALTQLHKGTKSFKRLADLVGAYKNNNSKISVYELEESLENENVEDIRIPTLTTLKENQNSSTILVPYAASNGNSKNQPQRESPEGNKKKITRKHSQSAVIIIPIEVESLSKVEVILVEHSDNPKKAGSKRGKEVIPCLNYS